MKSPLCKRALGRWPLVLIVAFLSACQPIQREAFTEPTSPAVQEAVPPMETDVTVAQAPGLSGAWEGVVDVAGMTLTVLADLQSQDGVVTGSVRFPQQGSLRLPVHHGSLDGSDLHFEILDAPNSAAFDGTLAEDGNITGAFTQSGYEGTFKLARATTSAAPTPVAAAKPYSEEEVTIASAETPTATITLAGTLSLPQGDGPFPAVVLVTGSGAQDRNEDLSVLVPGYQPFAEIADRLARAGIAVLRYDERGVGDSTGDFTKATTADFAADALAAMTWLRGRSEIDPARVGILGHSEGGNVAAMLVGQDPALAFAVVLSGPAVPGSELLVQQVRRLAETSGATAEQAEQAASDEQAIVEAALAGDKPALEAAVEAAMRSQLETVPPEQLKALGDVEALIARNLPVQVNSLLAPWMQDFLRYDPAPDWAKAQIPVLALLGEKDVQVDAKQNLPAFETALSGNPNATILVIPNANHLYQQAVTGAVQEYATLEPHLMAEVLDLIVGWLQQVATSPE